MLTNIIGAALKLLGLANGASTVNKVVGVLNYAAILPLITYLVKHADEQVHFSASLGFLALLTAFVFVLLEVARRSRPHDRGDTHYGG